MIDLLPGTTAPRGKIYPLSPNEQKAMEEYVQEALKQDILSHLLLQHPQALFFVEKKDRGL